MPGNDGRSGASARRPQGRDQEPAIDLGQTRRHPQRRGPADERLPRPAPVVVLVHGGFLGPWIWTRTIEELERQGLRALTVDLPSMRGPDGDLRDDARTVRDLLDGLDEVVLCGHSYAGMVITEAAAGPHRAVRHLVYLTAAIPDSGDSLAGLNEQRGDAGGEDTGGKDTGGENTGRENTGGENTGGENTGGEEVEQLADGRIALRRDSALESLFHDCSPERAAQAVSLLRPENPVVGTQPVQGSAWRSLPFTYVRGDDDRLPELLSDAAAERPHEVVTLPTGHCPQWSRPDLVAGLLARIAHAVANR
ncbi:alpha/beta hydrolase [Actinomadura sp. 7K507]|uniref:alpha/beta fold hydrolase n=1 Tax=Actinomadura sp. 7K507 TaxID=2530365 RepID=UPI001404AAB3|nr:alpha/beta hydrolase [Actinomadura sp. 7K507]